MSINLYPTCPDGCSTILAPVDFDLCVPSVNFGEITHIYVAAGDADGFTDVEDLAEWTARISEDSVDPNAIRDLFVIADLPAATAEEITISLNRKIFSPASHVINIEIDDVTAETYAFARTTSCNVQFKFWFSTPTFMFGGDGGLIGVLNLRPQIERGYQSVNKLVGTLTWSHQFSPERHINPFATT